VKKGARIVDHGSRSPKGKNFHKTIRVRGGSEAQRLVPSIKNVLSEGSAEGYLSSGLGGQEHGKIGEKGVRTESMDHCQPTSSSTKGHGWFIIESSREMTSGV